LPIWEQGAAGGVDGLVPAEVGPVAHLDDRAGVEAARPGGGELALLVATPGDVVLEQAAGPPAQVVAGEERHDDEALAGGREVAADHLGQLVGLALDR